MRGDGIREDTELSRWFIFLLETYEEPCFSKDKKISKMQTRNSYQDRHANREQKEALVFSVGPSS